MGDTIAGNLDSAKEKEEHRGLGLDGNTKETTTAIDGRSSTTATSSSWRRKLDIFYLVFFLIHIPVILLIDIVPLYPRLLVPPILLRLRAWYIAQYADRFFSDTLSPAWFRVYLWMEAGYHLPVSVWAVKGLWVGTNPLLPLHLLLFAFQAALTTATCLADMQAWPVPFEQKIALTQIYVPYLIFALILGTDMFLRLKRKLLQVG